MGIKVKSLGIWRYGFWGVVIWGVISLLSVARLTAAGDLRLVDASEKGDKDAVRSLLKQHADVNSRQPDGATALSWAAYHDDLDTAGLLIAAGANANVANDYGATPLSLACTNGSAAMVDKLLKGGANPNAAVLTGETALMRCAYTGNVDAVKSLLARGADVAATETRQGHNALMWAAAQKHTEVARALIERGADVNARSKSGFTPLMFAAQQGDMDTVRLLLSSGAKVNEATLDGDTALLVASASGHEPLSIFLLDQGADPNAADRNGLTAMHYCIMKGLAYISGIRLQTFAPYLSRPNMVELVKALLAHGANPNARLLKPAINYDNLSGYGKVLKIHNPPPGTVNPVGSTPFMLAALTSDAGLMRILAAGGANPLLATEENVTPLMAAAGLIMQRSDGRHVSEQEESKSLEAVKLAVELGADVNAADTLLGLTALHGAAFRGLNTVVQFLVEKGAKLDAKDKAGQTPLHKAENIQPPGAVARNLIPYIYWKSTAELLLKLGATPVSDPAAQASDAGSVNAAGAVNATK